jgi:hypothetical protein
MGTSDPVFIARFGREPMKTHPEFLYDAAEMEELFVAGDKDVRDSVCLAREGVKSEVVPFLEGTTVYPGPLGRPARNQQSVQDAEKCLEYDMDGIVVSNHGMGHVPLGFRHDTN